MSNTELTQQTRREIKPVQLGEWSMNLGPEITVGPESHLKEFLSETLVQYRESYRPAPGTEHAYYQMYGASSPIVRVDMPLPTGAVAPDQGIFEVEARPAGLGISALAFPDLNQYFQGASEQVLASGHKIAVKVLPYARAATHDSIMEKALFAESIGAPIYGPGELTEPEQGTLYYVYGDSAEAGDDVEAFERQSLFPVRDDGNKDYLITMGLAQAANPALIAEKLAAGETFAMKPRRGMWAQDCYIKTGAGKEGKINGRDTASKIQGAVDANPDAYVVQPLHMPGKIDLGLEKPLLGMARVFALHNQQTGDFDVVGGVYVARSNIKLHGTSDAVTGRLHME